MKPLKLDSRRSRALSQFEVILVMAMIGVISAVAFPMFSNLAESSKLGVLKSNLHHMNSIIREAYRAGSVVSSLDFTGKTMTTKKVCEGLTSGSGVFVDLDGDGTMDLHEIGFEMDIPTTQDPYEYLVGQHLFGDYTVKVEGDDPMQLAIYDKDKLHEIP